jgi:hypothetical protein
VAVDSSKDPATTCPREREVHPEERERIVRNRPVTGSGGRPCKLRSRQSCRTALRQAVPAGQDGRGRRPRMPRRHNGRAGDPSKACLHGGDVGREGIEAVLTGHHVMALVLERWDQLAEA